MKRDSDNEKIVSMFKKPRVSKSSDESLETVNNSGDKESGSGVENDKKATCTGEILGAGNSDSLKKENPRILDFNLNVADIDLNVPTLEAGERGNYSVDEKKLVAIDIISSDSSDDEEAILVSKILTELRLGIGSSGGDNDVGGGSSMDGGRRYNGSEKGKVKVEDSWLPQACDHGPLELEPRTLESIRPRNENTPTLKIQELEPRAAESTREIVVEPTFYQTLSMRRVSPAIIEWEQIDRRRTAARLARLNSKDHHSEETADLDTNLLTDDGPFAVALRNVREQTVIHKSKSLIEWSPSLGGYRKKTLGVVPSLLELSLKVLAESAAAIVSLEGVPYILRKRLADLICNQRSMNSKTLDLFVRGSPAEICVKDCHWLTEDQFSTAFGNIDVKNLVVLQLELCGQCNFDYVMGQTFAGSLNSLPNLAILSLKGASRLTDDAVKALVRSAPTLQSINLSQCTLVTENCINFIADAIGPTLKELYIDECPSIDAMLIETALSKLKILEVLSVAGMQDVCDKLVEGVVTVSGKTLKELNLADCMKLTNCSLEVIARTCSGLHSLNISKLHQLTDMSLEYLTNGCQLVQSLTLHENRFSDEAIAAFVEISGKSMKNLSLNNVSKVGCSTAMSLAKHSRGLLSLDLSWCRRVTNEELGLIVDCCLSLRLLKLFGCTQITDVFLNGHSNTQVRIVGLKNTPLLKHMDDLKPDELLLRYSEILQACPEKCPE